MGGGGGDSGGRGRGRMAVAGWLGATAVKTELRRRSSGKRRSVPLLSVPPAPAERRLGRPEGPSSVLPRASAAAAGRWACLPAASLRS